MNSTARWNSPGGLCDFHSHGVFTALVEGLVVPPGRPLACFEICLVAFLRKTAKLIKNCGKCTAQNCEAVENCWSTHSARWFYLQLLASPSPPFCRGALIGICHAQFTFLL